MGRATWVLLAALAACGDDGAAAPAAASETVDDPAARAPADPDAAPTIARVDDTRRIARTAALLDVALEVADGTYQGKLTKDGVRLDRVPDGSTLAELGLRAGDVVERIAGVPIHRAADLRTAWRAAEAAGVVDARVVRGAEHVELRVFLAEPLGADAALEAPLPPSDAIDAALVSALATGVRQTSADAFEIDARLIGWFAEEVGLAEQAVSPRYARPEGVSIAPDAPLGVLGVTRWDTITAIGVVDVRTPAAIAPAFSDALPLRELTVSIVRVRDPMVLRYRLVDGLLDPGAEDAVDAWRLREEARRAEREAARAAADAVADDVDRHIRRIDDTHHEVDRALLDRALADPMAFARGARVVPAMKNGKADGLKLYAIRPSSVYARLGFMNGDTVHAVNGHSVSSPDRALDVYQRLRTARRLTFDVTRRGKPVTVTITIR